METALLEGWGGAGGGGAGADPTPTHLSWYPQRLGWQLAVSRAALRGKDWHGADAPGAAGRTASLKALHKWLLMQTELGKDKPPTDPPTPYLPETPNPTPPLPYPCL